MCALIEDGLSVEAIAYFKDKWIRDDDVAYLQMLADMINNGFDKKVAFCMTITRYFTHMVQHDTIQTLSNN